MNAPYRSPDASALLAECNEIRDALLLIEFEIALARLNARPVVAFLAGVALAAWRVLT